MKYKNVKKLNKWLRKNNYNVKCYNNDSYEYNVEQEMIGVNKDLPQEYVFDFYDLCYDLGLKDYIDINALCFLHELGHHETGDNFSQMSEYLYNIKNKFIDIMIKLGKEKNIRYWNRKYQRIPQEITATQFAVDFANENPEQVKELETIFQAK